MSNQPFENCYISFFSSFHGYNINIEEDYKESCYLPICIDIEHHQHLNLVGIVKISEQQKIMNKFM